MMWMSTSIPCALGPSFLICILDLNGESRDRIPNGGYDNIVKGFCTFCTCFPYAMEPTSEPLMDGLFASQSTSESQKILIHPDGRGYNIHLQVTGILQRPNLVRMLRVCNFVALLRAARASNMTLFIESWGIPKSPRGCRHHSSRFHSHV